MFLWILLICHWRLAAREINLRRHFPRILECYLETISAISKRFLRYAPHRKPTLGRSFGMYLGDIGQQVVGTVEGRRPWLAVLIVLIGCILCQTYRSYDHVEAEKKTRNYSIHRSLANGWTLFGRDSNFTKTYVRIVSFLRGYEC